MTPAEWFVRTLHLGKGGDVRVQRDRSVIADITVSNGSLHGPFGVTLLTFGVYTCRQLAEVHAQHSFVYVRYSVIHKGVEWSRRAREGCVTGNDLYAHTRSFTSNHNTVLVL